MAHRRLDPDLGRHADDDERAQPAIAEGHVERRPLERRHRKLVEDGFGGQRRDLRDQLEARRIAEEPGPDFFGGGNPLPGHRHAQLECSHQLLRQRHVAREEDPHTGFARGPEHLDHLRRDRGAVLQLTEDADLHVVDDERGARRRARFRERLGNLEMVCPDHSRLLFGPAVADECAGRIPSLRACNCDHDLEWADIRSPAAVAAIYLAGGGRALAPGASAHQSSGKFIFFSRARYRGSPRRFRSSGSDFTCISPVSGNAYARSSHSNARSNSRLYAYTWAIW